MSGIMSPPIIKQPQPPLIIYIDGMPLYMHTHIERVMDVWSNGNCEYHVVSGLLDKGEENHTLVRQTLISELTVHSELYTRLYVTTEKFNKVHHALSPSVTVCAPVDKWMGFPEMDHLIASAYESVCIDLTRYGFSETFFLYRLPRLKIHSAASRVLGTLDHTILFRFI
ncbi:unnamed protein product [Vicia faba]|uniref:Uncharacterized protein n=1 Tax=Vicia faba TaxID=3906 RepID=A0AAV1BB62_VICFA|nr:unnamed protein product [Vicia faba]